MPMLLWLILQYFPVLAQKVAVHHWRNISVLLFLSAYGMLASFPFQGYGAVSITFSTISVFASYYLAFVIWQASKELEPSIPIRFLKAGTFYLVLSSIGPFATGPLLAMGKGGSTLYFDAIYFYLHFQYNGWFTFVILSVLISIIERKKKGAHSKKIYFLLNASCAPAFLLSTLWHQPNLSFYLIGGVAALLQVVAFFYLLNDFLKLKEKASFENNLIKLGLFALGLKLLLQALSALPAIANLAFENRNFVIAYLHLVMLGFISLLSIAFMVKEYPVLKTKALKTALAAFLIAFTTTETLLAAQASGLSFSSFSYWLIALSCLFPVAVFGMFSSIKKQSLLLD